MTEPDAEENPFSSQTLEESLRQSKHTEIDQRRAYFALPIAEKTRIEQMMSKRDITHGVLRQEDYLAFGTTKPANERDFPQVIPEGFLPDTFKSTRRQGVKEFIERTRMLCRLSSDCSMREEEIRSINTAAIQRCADLEREELELNRREIEIERELRENEELSIKGQRNDELSGLKLDEIYRKIDELNAALENIFEEIQRQTESLKLNVTARNLIETVASLGGEDFDYLLKKRREIQDFFSQKPSEDALLTSRPPEVLSVKGNPKQRQKSDEPKPLQSDCLFPLRTKAVLELAQRYVQFPSTISLEEVEEHLSPSPTNFEKFEIDFDFQRFVADIENGFDQQINPRGPLMLEEEIISDSALTKNPSPGSLVRTSFNAFEELYEVECDTRIMNAVDVLVESYDYPPHIPFEGPEDFNDNLQLLEETTLVRTQNLQELRHMTEQQQAALSEGESVSRQQEEEFRHQISEINERISVYRRGIVSFDKNLIANSAEDFIYDLNKYQSSDELEVDKESDELDFLHQSIAQAGVFSGSIEADDRSSISNNILARMELVLNQTMEYIYKYSHEQIKEARYILDKKRREVARNAKMNEMLKQNEKEAERRKIREDRLKRDKIVARPVVGKCFLEEKKKTQVQIELEMRLKKEQLQGQGDEGDFYQ